MTDPVCSVVIPCFNAAATLAETVASVFEQGIAAIEVVIVDDGSSDGSRAIAAALAGADRRVRPVARAANGGPAAARNDGLAASRGAAVCFLDADDTYAPGTLAAALALLDRYPWLVSVQVPVTLWGQPPARPVGAGLALIASSLPSNLLIRRRAALDLGGFPEDAAFRSPLAGEDVAFRRAARRWGPTGASAAGALRYRVRPGDHFDLFLDRLGQPGRNQEVEASADYRRLGEAEAAYRAAIMTRMRTRAGVGPTRTVAAACQGAPVAIEIPDCPQAEAETRAILSGRVLTPRPVGSVRTVLDLGAGAGAAAVLFAAAYPGARVIALEPALAAFCLLLDNVAGRRSIQPLALGLDLGVTTGDGAKGPFAGVADFLAFTGGGIDVVRIRGAALAGAVIGAAPALLAAARLVYVDGLADHEMSALDQEAAASHRIVDGGVPTAGCPGWLALRRP